MLTISNMDDYKYLDSLLVTNQMAAYLQQVNQFCGQNFAKLFLMLSLNASHQ